MAGVATEHTIYERLAPQWERCRDCAAGVDAVKGKGVQYLPRLDSHLRNPEKYTEYKQRAMFYNATGRTIAGLSGAIFQKAPSIDPHNETALLHAKDITLTGEPLNDFSLRATREYLVCGRFGILIDMATVEAVEPRPYWTGYNAEDIVNWKFENMGGDKELVLAVLREYRDEVDPDDEFNIETVIQYRVLRLTPEGIYTQQVYTEIKGQPGDDKKYAPGPTLTPVRRGKPLDFIPFSLPWAVNAPPLLDLVEVNLAHYRGTADLKHGLHFTALPTPWVSGQTDTNKVLAIGSGTAWALDKDGKAGMLEFTGHGLGAIRQDLMDMQRQMATLGARLLEEAPHYAETALSVAMRHSSDYATLRMIGQTVEQQLSWALKVHVWWLGNESLVAKLPANVELNKIFYDQSVTADELRALILALQGSTISYKTFYERLAATGWAREGITEEEEIEDIKKDGDQFKPPEKPGAVASPGKLK